MVDLPVETFDQVSIFWVLKQLVEHPGDSGGANPLSCMNPSIDPNRLLVPASTSAHLSEGLHSVNTYIHSFRRFVHLKKRALSRDTTPKKLKKDIKGTNE
jgi:hypothetical protein